MAIYGVKINCSMLKVQSFKTLVPSAGYTGGQMLKINDTIGIIIPPLGVSGGGSAAPAIDAGENCAFAYRAPIVTVPCEAATTGSYLPGAKVYFNATLAEITETASGNDLCGTVYESPALGATECVIDFDGRLALVS